MSKTLNLHEAKAQLSQRVDDAAAGEEIIVARAGVPRARLVALRTVQRPRRPGGGKDHIWLSDEFDVPLPAEILACFHGTS